MSGTDNELKRPSEQQRLDSWKEIGAYFGRDERTVKRWERERGLPVHRVPGSGRGRVYAYTNELADWLTAAGSEASATGEEAPAQPVAEEFAAKPPASNGNGTSTEAQSDSTWDPGPRPASSVTLTPAIPFPLSADSSARVAEVAHRLALVQKTSRPEAVAEPQKDPGVPPASEAAPQRPSIRGQVVVACIVAVIVCVGVVWRAHEHQQAAVHAQLAAQAAAAQQSSAANAQAENLYLQGKFFWQQRTPDSLTKAVDLFTQAIVHDPQYAPAYAGLAECYELLREFSNMADSEAFPRALSAAQQAVQLNPNLAQGHAALAFALFYWNWDTKRAMDEFATALRLDPNAAQTHHWYATSLMSLGDGKNALLQIDEARRLDPGSRAILADKGWILGEMGDYAEARSVLEPVVQAAPEFFSGHNYLAWVAFRQGDGPTFAREYRTSGVLIHDASREDIARTVEAAYRPGASPAENVVAMQKALDERTRTFYKQGKGEPTAMAEVLLRQGDVDGAFRRLDDGFARRDSGIRYLLMNPEWKPYQKDPRFVAVQRKLGVE